MISTAKNLKPLILRLYLALAAAESLAAAAYLLAIPPDSKNAQLLGYSAPRLFLLSALLAISFIFSASLVSLIVSRARQLRLIERLTQTVQVRAAFAWIIVSCALALAAGLVLLLIPAAAFPDAAPTIARLAPLAAWIAALALQTILALLLWRAIKFHPDDAAYVKGILRTAAICWGMFLLLSSWMLVSGLGLTPDRSGWYSPGTPLLFSQVLAACLCGLMLILFEQRILRWISSLRGGKGMLTMDAAMFVLLWLAAFIIWQHEPLKRWSYFTSAPTPPNNQFYPYSDAAIYDQAAEGLMIGISRSSSVMLRPLYTFFLALLHTMVGQRYDMLVLIQGMLLAAIPAIAYLLVCRLSTRAAGVVTALLIILRERNSIALTNIVEVSHSKLLLSDVPAMGLIVLFLYLCIIWLQDSRSSTYRGVFAGAALGLAILVRSQAQVLIPLTILALILVRRYRAREIIWRASLFVLGAAAVITPWVWRNGLISGHYAVENPEFYIRILASGYVHSQTEIEPLPNESGERYYARMKSQILKFIADNPGEVTHFYLAHYLHDELDSVVYLPLTFKLYPLIAYVRQQTIWKDPSQVISTGAFVVLTLNLALISLGIAAAFQRAKWLGLFPLLTHFGYAASIVPMRLSGWRFILPVDWVALLYYGIGITVLTSALVALVRGGRIVTAVHDSATRTGPGKNPALETGVRLRSALSALVIPILFGLSLPIIELLTPVKYPALAANAITQKYIPQKIVLADGSSYSQAELPAGAVILYGRALYPNYYQLGDYWGEENSATRAASQFNRIQFSLIGPHSAFVYLPLSNAPNYFADGSEVVVIGCPESAGVRALIVFLESSGKFLQASPWNGFNCAPLK